MSDFQWMQDALNTRDYVFIEYATAHNPYVYIEKEYNNANLSLHIIHVWDEIEHDDLEYLHELDWTALLDKLNEYELTDDASEWDITIK